MRRRALRKKVFERDRGVCCNCSLDTEAVRERMAQLQGDARAAAWKFLEAEGFDRSRSFWEADHQLALDEEGRDELENLVTRCRPCHREKTSEQATRKAFLRKIMGRKFLEDRARRSWRIEKGGKTPTKKPARPTGPPPTPPGGPP